MKIQSLLACFGFILLLLGCSKDNLEQNLAGEPSVEPMSKAEMDAIVEKNLHEADAPFRWAIADSRMLWSASVRSDSIMALGYKPANLTNIEGQLGLIDTNAEEWLAVRKRLIQLVVDETNKEFRLNATASDLFLSLDWDGLPVLDVKIFSQRLIERLRAMPEVRYLEPMTYALDEIERRSDSGCGVTPASSIPSADFTTTSPNVRIPWNFSHSSMNVPQAWNTSTGAGIKVAMIDTGTSPNQPKLGSQFNSGNSSGRTLERLGTHITGWWWSQSNEGPNDQCGHGTQMGLIAAPRGFDGTAVGVAYNSNLKAFRSCTDVVINASSEKAGVRDALVISGNDSAVRIISMSIGDVFYSSTVADGIFYAFNRGKLIFAAAGTSFSWTSWWGVIFPANMAETVAVTGIKDSPSMQRCNTCHSGSAVDFVAVMQRASDNSRTSLTLAMSGNQPAYVGGSSAATATTAGIAALVWATNPAQTRTQVLNRLRNASSFHPNRSSEFGWGTINAAAAVAN